VKDSCGLAVLRSSGLAVMRSLRIALTSGVLACAPIGAAAQTAGSGAFEVHEASITELQNALAASRVTSVQLVDAYMARIAAYDQAGPRLNAMIRLNPTARMDAALLDQERKAGRVRGPLHGIPIILKDNFDTKGMVTAGSSVALASLVTAEDAFQVRKLREAGVIVLGKSNMHELAAGITTISSLGGQTRNPYDPRRNPGGSSGGTGAAVAASFAAIAWGSDTCGSIRIPAAFHNLFGLRPTKGLSSITGIIPLSHTQDVGGPLARTVTDLAIGLDATVGADPADPATRILEGRPLPRFAAALDSTSLRGARIGMLTSYFGSGPDDDEAVRIVRAAIDQMKQQGAEIVDLTIGGLDNVVDRASVIAFEFKWDLMDYLATRPGASVKTLGEIVERGLHHVALENTFRTRDSISTRTSDPYRAALARRDSARTLVSSAMETNRLDAIVYPTVRRKPALIGEAQRGTTCQLSAVTGLPALSMPAGFTPDGLPVGVELLGRALDDARLVSFAFDYERATRPRRAPPTTPALTAGARNSVVVTASGAGNVRAQATFTLHTANSTLEYDVRVTGVAPDRVHAVSLNRGTSERSGPSLIRLSGAGVSAARGIVELGATERNELMEERLFLTLYTADAPHGAARAPVVWTGRLR
jgi:amidase